ncbi:hypothetical protein, partial [Paenibacillus tianmuensis]|uniref:hypothetical protein n=1 Tax=Paenibacillus tianmuensis TaxID=624147 RepID=UPI001C25E69F
MGKLNSNFEQARERIKNLNWESNGMDKPSYAILVTEFIRACLKTHDSGTTSTKSWQKPKKQSSKSFEKV